MIFKRGEDTSNTHPKIGKTARRPIVIIGFPDQRLTKEDYSWGPTSEGETYLFIYFNFIFIFFSGNLYTVVYWQ